MPEAKADPRNVPKSAHLPHALQIPSHIFGYVLAESGWHQLALAVLTAIVFLLEIVPLELQRRIINDLTKDRNFRFVILLCAAYGGTVLVQDGTKAGWGWRRFCCFCRNLSLCRSCRRP